MPRLPTACCAVALLLAAAPALAQRAEVLGRVVDAEHTAPLVGVSVTLDGPDGTTRGQATDRAGRFAFGGLLPGTYVLTASSLGYASAADTLAVAFGDRVERTLTLDPGETALGDVTVEADPAIATSSPAGLVQIRPADLAAIPAPDLSGDLLGVLTLQPGVVTLGDRGGQLYIRGGTPTENLVLIDGMRLFQPFHIVGFYSAFPAEIVRQADVYAGGFGARYGGRISSVIDVQTTNGNKQRFAGAASVAPFLTSLRVEGPIVRGEVSVVASVRESVIERVASQLLGEPLPYRFGDAFAKLHAFTGPASFVSITGLRTTDEGDITGSNDERTRIDWTNEALGGRFFFLPQSFAAALDITVNYAAYRSSFEAEDAPARDADTRSFGGEFALAYFLERAEVRFGFGAQTLTFDYTLDRAAGRRRESTTEGHFFVEADVDLGRGLRVEPGLRLQTFPAQSRTVSLEPRLRAAWDASAAATLSGALGVYRQEIVGLSDERDIGDVFTAWAPIPQNAPMPRALHALAGVEVRPRRWLHLGAEAYAKQLADVQVLLGRRGLVRSHGEVYGLDLRAEWRRAPVYLFVGYGLSAATYRNAREAYRPPHDRRHRLQFAAELERGPYRFAARWQLASGRPFTRLRGVFDDLGTPDGDAGFVTAPGIPTVVTEPAPFRGLTPPYHRLDLSFERDFAFRSAVLTLQASAVNAYDRANFFYYDAVRAERIDQFPFIPSVGLRVEVR